MKKIKLLTLGSSVLAVSAIIPSITSPTSLTSNLSASIGKTIHIKFVKDDNETIITGKLNFDIKKGTRWGQFTQRPNATKVARKLVNWGLDSAGVITALKANDELHDGDVLHPIFSDVGAGFDDVLIKSTDSTNSEKYISLDLNSLCQTTGNIKTKSGDDLVIGDVTQTSANFNQPIIIGSDVPMLPDNFLSGFSEFASSISIAQDNNQNNLVYIGQGFMYGCVKFNEPIELQKANNLLYLGNNFMYGCSIFAQNLEIPTSVASIGSGFLNLCDSLTSVVFPGDASIIDSSIGDCFIASSEEASAFKNGVSIYTNSTKTIINESITDKFDYLNSTNYRNLNNEFIIRGDLKYKKLSNSEKTVYVAGIIDSPSSTSLDFPNRIKFNGTTENWTVKTIGENAFKDKTNITSINIPYNTTIDTVAKAAFSGCTGLNSITIPVDVVGKIYFEDGAFDSVAANGSIITVGDGSTVSDNIQSAENIAYIRSMFKQAGITADIGIASEVWKLTKIETGVTDDYKGFNLFTPSKFTVSSDGEDLISVGDQTLTGNNNILVVPASIKEVKSNSLQSLSSLSADITFDVKFQVETGSESIFTKIDSGAFASPHLASIDLTNTKVNYIGDNAFTGCTKLTSIKIPKSVIGINPNAFMDCSALAIVDISDYTTIPSWMSVMQGFKYDSTHEYSGSIDGLFVGCPTKGTINVNSSFSEDDINNMIAMFKMCVDSVTMTEISKDDAQGIFVDNTTDHWTIEKIS